MESAITEEEAPKTPRDRVKYVTGLVVGTSVGSVVKTLIRQNMVPKNNLQNVEMYIAAFALGGLIAKQATEHTDAQIDKYADMFLKAKAESEARRNPEPPE